MQIIYPKRPIRRLFTISDQTSCTIETFAKYAGISEDDVVDRFLMNLLCDPNFASYLKGMRRNKRLINRIFYGDVEMKLIDEYAKDVQVIPIDFDSEVESENEKSEGKSEEKA